MLIKKQSEKRKYKRHDWRIHLKRWQASGLRQSEYCRQNNLSNRSFSNNKKKYINRAESTAGTKKFIKIPSSVVTGDSAEYEFEIILPGNIRICVNNNFNPVSLTNLIKALTEL